MMWRICAPYKETLNFVLTRFSSDGICILAALCDVLIRDFLSQGNMGDQLALRVNEQVHTILSLKVCQGSLLEVNF